MLCGRRKPLSPESGIRGSGQQSVGGTMRFANHVDSLMIANRAVRREIFGRENKGEVSSRVPREEGSSPIQYPGGGSSRVVQDQALLRINDGGNLQGLKQAAAFSIGRNLDGGSRRLRSLPGEDDDSVTGFTEIYGTHRSPHKGKAVMGVAEKRGVREKGVVEGVGESEGKKDHNWVEVGRENSMGLSAHMIPGVGLAKRGLNINSQREAQGRRGDPNKGQEQREDAATVAGEAFVFGAKSVSSSRRPPRKWKSATRVAAKYSFEALLQQQNEEGAAQEVPDGGTTGDESTNEPAARMAKNKERVEVVQWSPPGEDVLKVNVDASFVEDRNRVGVGAVIRDSRGLVLCCAIRQYNFIQDSLVAEMQAIQFGEGADSIGKDFRFCKRLGS
ncbi:hypothetical protein COLO4_25803 [Corchorus olitorius]|uniref:RNase H type-1 domain-containing protein n=1 Tax=Corchorus olitorius TaxID=93759 RepID=A0A1R3HZX6_9ROSI|nr:hypothetical protein COLO4_25803 [Corchorus olitorius]